MKKKIFLVGFMIVGFIVLLTQSCLPAKKGKLSHNETSLVASKYFWDNFHAGNYDSLSVVIEKLSEAYLYNTSDYKIAALLGFAHTWAIAECERLDQIPYSIINHNTLALKYFEESHSLNPHKDWRIYGFYAATYIIEAAVNGHERKMIPGMMKLQKSVRKYPEFNLFTKAYPLSQTGSEKHLERSIKTFWKNLNKCLDESSMTKVLDTQGND